MDLYDLKLREVELCAFILVTSSRRFHLPPIVTAAAKKWRRIEDNNVSLNSSGISINTQAELAALLGKLTGQSDNNCCYSVPSPHDVPMPTCHELVIN